MAVMMSVKADVLLQRGTASLDLFLLQPLIWHLVSGSWIRIDGMISWSIQIITQVHFHQVITVPGLLSCLLRLT